LKKTSVLIVGAGFAANRYHIPAWKKIKDAEVKAICDTNGEQAKGTARRWKISHVYTDLDRLLEEEQQGIVDIVTSPQTHVPLAERAMDADQNVILEKPMTMSIKDTERLLSHYHMRKDHVRMCVVQNQLLEPQILKLRAILKQKRLDIVSIDLRMLHPPNEEYIANKSHWVHELPGGRFGENLIHPIYILQNFMGGNLHVRDVFAVKRGLLDWVNFDELHVALDNGVVYGNINISFNSPRLTTPFSLRIYARRAILNFDGTNMTRIFQGALFPRYPVSHWVSRPKLVVDSLNSCTSILWSTSENIANVLPGMSQTGHEILFRHFVNAIAKDREMPYTFEESCKANKTFLEVLSQLSTK
jgi:predicted dehydrogenase